MFLARSTKIACGAALVAAAGILSAPSFAQSETTTPSAAQDQADTPSTQATPEAAAPGASSQNFSDDKLKSFAVAYLQVDRVTQEYLPKLKQAKDTGAQQKVREEAGQKMVQAVESSNGISVNEYNQIAQSAQTDPELASKLTKYIQEADK